MRQEQDDLSTLAVESVVLAALTDATRMARRTAPPAPRWLVRAREMIQTSADHLSLADIARTVGVHPVHLAQTFRRVFGQTVAGYVRHLRIEQACSRLSATDAPLAEIALAAGFFDQSHFCRAFRRAMRMTPREYRIATRGASGTRVAT